MVTPQGVSSMSATEQAARDDGEPTKLQQMISEEEVLERIPVSRATLERMQRKGRFPKGRYVTPNRKLYFLAEVVKWQATVDERDPKRRRGWQSRLIPPATTS
jgi:prophage regulatory protein